MSSSPVILPERAHEALQSLARLDSASFDTLLKAISSEKPVLSTRTFAGQIAAAFGKSEQAMIRKIVDELFNVVATRDSLTVSDAEIAENVSCAAREADSKEFPLTQDDHVALQQRIQKVLAAAPTLTLINKAQDVLVEHQHVYYSARIFTDVRPVFSEVEGSIDAVGIVHNLSIHFGEGLEHREFFVALDPLDIQALRHVLDRAEAKASAIETLLQRASVSYLE